MRTPFFAKFADARFKTIPLLSAAAFALVCATGGNASAAASTAGTSGAQFLKLGVGARAEGLAEAYTALAEGADAIYWNPAGIGNAGYMSASFMHASLFGELNYEFAGFTRTFGDNGTFGTALQYLSAGNIDQTDDGGFPTGSSMSPHDTAFSLAYANTLWDINLGVTGKYIKSTLDQSASTLGFDFGAQYPHFLDDRLTLAVVLQNLGGKLKFDQEGDPLPFTAKFGAAYWFSEKTLASLDISKPRDNNLFFSLGAETHATYLGLELAGRAGYTNKNSGDITGVTGITVGGGVKRGSMAVDYAFAPYGALGATSRISFSLAFGHEKKEFDTGSVKDTEYEPEVIPPPPAPAQKPGPEPEAKPQAPKEEEKTEPAFVPPPPPVEIKPDTDKSATPAVPSYEKKLRKY